jgi:hypothetical protein
MKPLSSRAFFWLFCFSASFFYYASMPRSGLANSQLKNEEPTTLGRPSHALLPILSVLTVHVLFPRRQQESRIPHRRDRVSPCSLSIRELRENRTLLVLTMNKEEKQSSTCVALLLLAIAIFMQIIADL